MNLRELAEALFLPVGGLVFALVAFPAPGEHGAAKTAQPPAPSPAAVALQPHSATLRKSPAPPVELARSAAPLPKTDKP